MREARPRLQTATSSLQAQASCWSLASRLPATSFLLHGHPLLPATEGDDLSKPDNMTGTRALNHEAPRFPRQDPARS